MGVTKFTDEHTSPTVAPTVADLRWEIRHCSPIPPSRIFKASIIDSHNLIPKLLPQAIKRVEFVQGDGGVGSVKQINLAEGSSFKSIKYRIDELNEKTFTYKYTLIEGEALIEKLEKITYDVKFEKTVDGGSISKVTSEYYIEGDFKLNEEEIKAGKERVLAMYKAVEAYLLQNPDAYA
ncbi:major allergen Pru ar 1-like [Lycium barbarum]|uniref:major allergen Pru ar 1-like n=1 Tax=Lycium barbarum TaxID=112863 RepID=UPI00293F0C44|nr:major allergen Pru ar 1-like [Lycium barbarum]